MSFVIKRVKGSRPGSFEFSDFSIEELESTDNQKIKIKHFFPSTYDRDQYFNEHEEEKEEGVIICVGTDFFKWNGSEWESLTLIFQDHFEYTTQEVELKAGETHIQWRFKNIEHSDWQNLVPYDPLKDSNNLLFGKFVVDKNGYLTFQYFGHTNFSDFKVNDDGYLAYE